MTNQVNPACRAFLDDLASMVQGDEAILANHVDHLADCDACRDRRHEAATAASLIADAGADYVHPADLEERFLAAYAAAASATATDSESATDSEAATDSEPDSESESATVTAAESGRANPRPAKRGEGPGGGRWRAWTQGGLFVAAAAGLIVYALGGSPMSGEQTEALPGHSWTATIATIDRAASDQKSGVRLGKAGGPATRAAAIDTAIPAGDAVHTDDRTRVELRLSDGSTLYLDHNTEVVLGQGGRSAELVRGSLVADIAHLEQGPRAELRTDHGTVEVLGTRFSLTRSDTGTSVRVIRGLVRLADSANKGSVDVRAGEEGVVEIGAAPTVTAVTDLTSSVGWSETLSGETITDRAPSGIGELMAFKPGEKRDRDWKLSLDRHRITVRIVGNVARTEIEETFQNDSDAVLEGIYKFPLPPDAKIESLALDVNGVMEEGAFIAKKRASKIWAGVIQKAAPKQKKPAQEIIWVPGPWRDPALLEWQRGGRFELRIFPIPKHGSRTIRLVYTQLLSPQGKGRRYVYPLPHRAQENVAGQFDVDIRIAGTDPDRAPQVRNYQLASHKEGDSFRLSMSQTQFTPRGDLIVDFTPKGGDAELRAWSFQGQVAAAPTVTASEKTGVEQEVLDAQRALAQDDRATALIALRPVLPRWTESRRRDYILVLDSSQSMVGERFARASKLAQAVVARMDRRDRFQVLACDVDCQSFAAAPSSASASASQKLGEWLGRLEPAGSTNLIGALEAAAEHGSNHRQPEHDVWVMYIGDGLSSTGYRRLADLRSESQALANKHEVAISTIGIGGDSDTSALATIARAGRGHYTPFVPGQRVELAALSVLETTFGVSLVGPELVLPDGLEEVAPRQLSTVRAGQELLITARHRGTVKGDVILRGTVGGEPFENRYPLELAPSTAAGNAFVPRLWASQTIEQLELNGRGEDEARIVALSQAFGVMSRHTSLLVLESPAMFEAFGVDRARPAVEWTGDEEAEVVASQGAVDFARTTSTRSGAGGAPAPMRAKRAEAMGDFAPLDDPFASGAGAPAREPLAQRRGRRMIPMRKVWYRVGSVAGFDRVHPNILAAIGQAESALRTEPNSRERHRALAQALAYGGDLARTRQVAESWLERDRLDAEALGYLADVLGRSGHRQRSIRVLSGAVDLQPDDAELHERLADAYQRIGADRKACSHRIALAAIRDRDADHLAQAVRCQQAASRSEAAQRTLDAIADSEVRQTVERDAARPQAEQRAHGELVISASWHTASDLDISLITPRGKRLSWLGGRSGLVSEGAVRAGSETLALRRIPAGNYLIEVARTSPEDKTPVRGQIDVTVLGQTQTLRFDLTEDHAVVGRINVSRRSRLVPL